MLVDTFEAEMKALESGVSPPPVANNAFNTKWIAGLFIGLVIGGTIGGIALFSGAALLTFPAWCQKQADSYGNKVDRLMMGEPVAWGVAAAIESSPDATTVTSASGKGRALSLSSDLDGRKPDSAGLA